jgi:Fibronectin type III domain
MKIAGHQISNWWLIGGGAGLILVVYLYKKGTSSSSGSSASGTNSSSAIDPVTGLPYSEDNQVDPLTGMTYLAEAQEYGSVQAAEAAVSSGSGYGGTSAYSGTAGYPTLNAYGNTTVNGTSYATNAAWAQAVTTGLVSLGYSAADVSAALGLFFAGQPLGTAPDGVSYATIVQAAEAEFGLPPQGTYQIIAAPTGSTTATGTGGTTTTGTGTTGTGSTGTGSTGTGTGTTGTGTGGGTYTGQPTGPATGTSSTPAKWQYPAPENLTASGAGAGKIYVSWAPVVGPQGQVPSNYTVAYGRTSGAHTWENIVSGTHTTLTTQNGMTEYIEVWANGGPIAPPHAGPVKATAGS